MTSLNNNYQTLFTQKFKGLFKFRKGYSFLAYCLSKIESFKTSLKTTEDIETIEALYNEMLEINEFDKLNWHEFIKEIKLDFLNNVQDVEKDLDYLIMYKLFFEFLEKKLDINIQDKTVKRLFTRNMVHLNNFKQRLINKEPLSF